jgi:hypothetical protein
VIGYHCVNEDDYDSVLAEGLLRSKSTQGCTEPHICIAETAEVAASMAQRGERVRLVEVNLEGLEAVSVFHEGEARVHNDIGPERITPYTKQVAASSVGWTDPGKRPGGNHPACLGVPSRTREHDIQP